MVVNDPMHGKSCTSLLSILYGACGMHDEIAMGQLAYRVRVYYGRGPVYQ